MYNLKVQIRNNRLKLTSVWLTAQTKEQMVKGATKISNKKVFLWILLCFSSQIILTHQVDELIKEAVCDIEWYQKNPSLFDYTILSNWFNDSDESNFELEQIFKKTNVKFM